MQTFSKEDCVKPKNVTHENPTIKQTVGFLLKSKGNGTKEAWVNLYKKLGASRYAALEKSFTDDLMEGRIFLTVAKPDITGADADVVIFVEESSMEGIAFSRQHNDGELNPEEIVEKFTNGDVTLTTFVIDENYKKPGDKPEEDVFE